MSLFNRGRESIPAPKPAVPQKPSFGIMESLGLRPMPKPEQKPQANAPVPFEKGQYRTFKELQGFTRGIRQEQVPGQSGKVYKPEAQKVEKIVEEYAKKMGKPYGISGRDIGSPKDAYSPFGGSQSILGRMQSDVEAAKKTQKWQEAKKLKRDIQIVEQWRKRGFK